MSKRVLVTGAAGFVGANLVRRLLSEGHEVIALVRDPARAMRLDSVAQFVEIRAEGDGQWIREANPKWVFHLAASGAYSWQTDAAAMVEANVAFTARLLELTEEAEAFIYAGSSSEYGYKDHAPTEDELPEPNSVYSATKLGATALCQQAGRRLQRPTLTARLYSVYGPFEDARRLIPAVIREGLAGRLPPFVDPEVARDFIHSDDACEAMILMAQSPCSDPTAIYNLGSGVQTRIRDVARVAQELFGIQDSPAWGSMANRGWDTRCWVGNPTKLGRELGWSAKSTFEEGFRETVSWFRENPNWLDPIQFQ